MIISDIFFVRRPIDDNSEFLLFFVLQLHIVITFQARSGVVLFMEINQEIGR